MSRVPRGLEADLYRYLILADEGAPADTIVPIATESTVHGTQVVDQLRWAIQAPPGVAQPRGDSILMAYGIGSSELPNDAMVVLPIVAPGFLLWWPSGVVRSYAAAVARHLHNGLAVGPWTTAGHWQGIST